MQHIKKKEEAYHVLISE